MYKCGWQGCEKAYGTLNHLNAHVTMQSHGQKRTPEGKSRVVFLFIVSIVANTRFGLDCVKSRLCGYASLSVARLSLIAGVGTTLHVALRIKHLNFSRLVMR